MTTEPTQIGNQEKDEEKTQAQLDYEEGQQFLQNDKISLAANMFHNALIGFEQEENEKGIANASDKLGDVCTARGDYEVALKHYERAFAICHAQGDAFSLSALDRKKAQLYAAWGKHDEAVNLYLDIIDECNAMKNPQGTVKTLEMLAQVYIDAGKRDMAADCFRTAAAIHKNFKHEKHAKALMKKAEEVENA
ncbi:MAG: tetratricopeptide repeat protein [Desulfobulbaceae bacterium]|nr:tetratricopeptide repeat protein [Desulfobulbaceae bacterium]